MGSARANEPPGRQSRKFARLPLAILSVALFIAIFDNSTLFRKVLQATMQDEHQLAIVLSMFLLVTCTTIIVLALAAGTRLFKLTAALLLVIAAATGFFMSEYGIVVDMSMIRNVAETEVREASPLVTSSFLIHVATFGLGPALALFLVPLGRIGWKRELAVRFGMITTSAILLTGTFYLNYGAVSYFGRQNHQIRLLINPAYPIYAYLRFLTRADDKPPTVRIALEAAVDPVHASRRKPTLMVFVMGETARADRFSFNGYERDTNEYTREKGVVNFANVTACGTSTADSVPCVFSGLGHDDFTHARFAVNESLFLALERLGVEAFWRDNSTGCKNVCDETHFEQLALADDPVLCDDTGCFDEILLSGFDHLIADDSHDHFIVLHQRGSHGPAYYTDTPQWAKVFLPECDLPTIRNCSRELINNAYDNTIYYTDYFLSRIVDLLGKESERFDGVMLYVSDHGESLGEKGLYLHGLPYGIAPIEQKRVPMLFWASPGFYGSNGLDSGCITRIAAKSASHDSLFHTILPLFDVHSPAYDRELDLFSPCRNQNRGDYASLEQFRATGVATAALGGPL